MATATAKRRTGPVDDLEALRSPILSQELLALQALKLDIEDWRQLDPEEVLAMFRSTTEAEDLEKRPLLAAALYVGTMQACLCGWYEAPTCADPRALRVSCQHLMRPISCLHAVDKLPNLEPKRVGVGGVSILGRPGCNALDAAVELSRTVVGRHVVVFRFTALGDPRSKSRRYRHLSEDELFLKTSYASAAVFMEADLHASPTQAIDQGGLIYTSGVGVFRGLLSEGAPWLEQPPSIDVAWIGLDPRPQLDVMDGQEQYAHDSDRREAARAVNHAFGWAAAHGADAVVLPPLGCGTHGCRHPRLDMADIIHKAIQCHAAYIPVVCVASDWPGHNEDSWWSSFEMAVQDGRPKVEAVVRVPPLPLPPWTYLKKEPCFKLEKSRILMGLGPRRTLALAAERSLKGSSHL